MQSRYNAGTRIPVFLFACTVALTILLGSAVHATSPYSLPWEENEHSVQAVLAQQEGRTVVCEATVAKIAARNNPPYFVLRDEWRVNNEPEARIAVMCRPPASLTGAVRVTGTLGRLPNNELCILNPTVEGLFDQQGRPVCWMPFPGLMTGNWQVLPIPTGSIPSSDPSLVDDGMGVSGEVSAYATAQGTARFETVASLLATAPPVLSGVELSAKPIVSVNAEAGYIVVGDDNSDLTIKVYTNANVKPKDRVIKLTAVVHSEGGQLTLYAGSGVYPYFDSQGLDAAGGVSTASPGSTAYAGTLRDAASSTMQSARAMSSNSISIMSVNPPGTNDGSWCYMTGRVVTSVGRYYSYDISPPGWVYIYYIQGIDRTPGIRVWDTSSGYNYYPGQIVDVMAKVDTKDGERLLGIIDNSYPYDYSSVECQVLDSSGSLLPRPVGMNNKALGGSDLGNNPGITGSYGLYNIGSYVTVWGKILETGTYQFDQNGYDTIQYMRIDDGSAVTSGNSDPSYGGPYGDTGVIIFGDNVPYWMSTGTYVSAIGPSSVWKPDGSSDTYRAIWAASSVQDMEYAWGGEYSGSGTISGTVTLYDMATTSADVTLYSTCGRMQTITVQRGTGNVGTASYSWTDVPTYDPNYYTAYYLISAKCDGYKTRTYTNVTPGTPQNLYLTPLRKITLQTQDDRTYIDPCSSSSLNIMATVRDDSHNPIVYPAAGSTVRFRTTAGSFNSTTLQQTATATTNASGVATVTLYGLRWAGTATIEATDDQTTLYTDDPSFPNDVYKCDWETLSSTITIYAPSVGVSVSANPTAIARCGSSYSTVTAHVTLCSGNAPTGTPVNFTIGQNDPCVFVSTGTKSATANTNSSGNATVQVRADDAQDYGTATITASANVYAGSGQGSTYVTVNEYSTNVDVSADPTEITGSGYSTVTFTATNPSGQPVQNFQLNIRTTAGTLSNMNPSTGRTNSNGQVTVRVTLTGAPAAYVSALYTDTCLGTISAGIPITYRETAWKDVAVGFSSPLTADLITGDSGKPEIGVIGRDGYAHIWKANGAGWDEKTFSDTISLDYNGDNTLSAADVDGRGDLEIVAPSYAETKVYTFGYNGSNFVQMAGWPADTTKYQFHQVSAALGDANLDGAKEVVAGDYSCWAFSWNGTGEWTGTAGTSYLWRNLTGSGSASIAGSSVALGDVDWDAQHVPDAVVGANYGGGALYSFPGDAWGDKTNPPLYTPGWETPRSTGNSIASSPAIGDIDGDGKNDVAVGCSDGICIYRSDNNSWTLYRRDSAVTSSPALADLDGDGKKDVVFGCNNGKVYAIKYDGSTVAGWENGILLHSDYGYAYQVQSSPAIADVIDGTLDTTGKPEVIVGCDDGFLYILYANGRQHVNSSSVTTGPVAAARCCRPTGDDSSRVLSSPTINDIDSDGYADIIVGSEGGMWRFTTQVTYDGSASKYPWPTFHHDAARTGCAITPVSPISSSIVGQVRDTSGNLAIGAEVYIYFQSDTTTSTVPVPKSSPVTYRTAPVKSVGNTGRTEVNRGGYSINQLQPSGQTYKIKVIYGGVTKWKQNITLSSGLNVIDLNMAQL